MIRLHLLALAALTSCFGAEPALPDWAIGPFSRPTDAQPVIRPNPDSIFACPMRGAQVRWEALHTFNPAAVVRDGKIHLLYRAEDDSGDMQIGGHTSRVGLASSEDGVHFVRRPTPVLFPAPDDQRSFEWTGGCEDPRVAEREDGTYVVLYTQYTGPRNGGKVRLGLASSKNLTDWTKHGSPFAGTKYENWVMKSAAIVHEVRHGRLIAAKINRKYWMYFGEHSVHLATSEDLIRWKPLEDATGKPIDVMVTRPGHFDSGLTEIGAQAVRTAKGIVVFYNGKNNDPAKDGDPELSNEVYACGQALFSAQEPAKLAARLDRPFFQPELPWEKTGQYAAGTTFSEGLVLFQGRWFLYYGCADTFVGVAVAAGR
ncbi:MAG TPA: glycoside hydrolase family 130 protein [Candidatus Acidoferrales bacterium]|nr:glycoside hydrolase family 130 protein [Candidatus Acidoferrales bacterium]